MFRSLFCAMFMCYSVYRLCVYVLFCVPFMCYSVYSITATGCQPTCSLLIIIITIIIFSVRKPNQCSRYTDYVAGCTSEESRYNSRPPCDRQLSSKTPKQALQPNLPPIQWAPGSGSLGVKRPGRETDYSFSCSDDVIKTGLYV